MSASVVGGGVGVRVGWGGEDSRFDDTGGTISVVAITAIGGTVSDGLGFNFSGVGGDGEEGSGECEFHCD